MNSALGNRGQEEDYQSLSTQYLENGLYFLQVGDIEKASEFLWGSMAAALKAVAEQRSIQLKTHSDIRKFARTIAREEYEPGIWDDYVKAEHLHANFYEAFLEREDLAVMADDLRERVDMLLGLASETV